MKTSELTGTALDWAVAKCKGVNAKYHPKEGMVISTLIGWVAYRPSVAWEQGGPIIESERIKLFINVSDTWTAQIKTRTDDGTLSGQMVWYSGSGPTPLIAAMRCVVVSRLGDEVDLPKELT